MNEEQIQIYVSKVLGVTGHKTIWNIFTNNSFPFGFFIGIQVNYECAWQQVSITNLITNIYHELLIMTFY